MGKTWDHISTYAQQVISKQHVFFVATAPLDVTGRVNVSPKGHRSETLSIINHQRVAYLDLTGSGIETVAHVKENGRITFMFCNFTDGPPCIIRLWGKAVVHERGAPDFNSWLHEAFPAAAEQVAHPGLAAGIRSIIVADIYEVASACGYAVPVMEYKHDRDTLLSWAATKKANEMLEYKQQKNMQSLDGLTGLEGIADDACSGRQPLQCNGSKVGASAAIAATPLATAAKWLQMHFAGSGTVVRPDAMIWLASGVVLGLTLAKWLNRSPQVAVTR